MGDSVEILFYCQCLKWVYNEVNATVLSVWLGEKRKNTLIIINCEGLDFWVDYNKLSKMIIDHKIMDIYC